VAADAAAGGRPAFGDRGGWGAFFAIIVSLSVRGLRGATVRLRSQQAPGRVVLLRSAPAVLPALELLGDPPRDHRGTPIEGGDIALGSFLGVQRWCLGNSHVDCAPNVKTTFRAVDIRERDVDVDRARLDADERTADPLRDTGSQSLSDCQTGDLDRRYRLGVRAITRFWHVRQRKQ
jgi:hypothetical protein